MCQLAQRLPARLSNWEQQGSCELLSSAPGCRINMEKHSHLAIKSSYSDLVINVGKVTLGESNRKKLQKVQREKEKVKVIQAACALLNSGGGVIQLEMANNDENLVEMGLDLEAALRTLILFSNLQAFFKTKQQGKCYYIFVKSWSTDAFLKTFLLSPAFVA
ncbi:unnamed protein product [Rangifer tarandus platyrhynchus]|uniref:Uncharacterized protein n=2 Tax=Rangifer tarandus platyrhynchus TaxID=3082113 RepID=A0AC59YXH9_RANTA|nr:unnamed protein product [Rangifer tarandus platyrhynchus]